jgi:peptide/nickel transport system substrate-binding protein
MQAQLKEVGVDVEIQTLEWTTYISAYVGGLDKASNDAPAGMGQLSYMIPQPDPGMYAYDLLAGQGSLNAGYYDNPEVDDLLTQARSELNPDTRIDLYKQAQALVADDAPWIFMFHAFNVVAAGAEVKNIVLNPDFNILHLERVYIEG